MPEKYTCHCNMKQRKLKKKVRERMAKTGEPYMVARSAILAEKKGGTVIQFTFNRGKLVTKKTVQKSMWDV